MTQWYLGLILAMATFSTSAFADLCPEADEKHHYVETHLDADAKEGKIRVYYTTPFGFDASKPTIVIINGGPGGDHSIVHAYDDLSTAFNVVGFDHRGLNCTKILSSEGADYETGLFAMSKAADDLEAIRKDLLGVKSDWYVYGISYGGMLAQQYAIDHPEHLSGVILDSTFHRSTAIDVGRLQYKKLFIESIEEVHTLYKEILQKYPEAEIPLLNTIFGDTYNYKGRTETIPELFRSIAAATDPAAAKELYYSEVYNGPMWGMSAGIACEEIWDHPASGDHQKYYLGELATHCPIFKEHTRTPMNWTEDLRKLPMPVLILAGTFDPVTPASVMHEMDSLIPNSVLVENVHSGHGIYFEKPECAQKLITMMIDSGLKAIRAEGAKEYCHTVPETADESVTLPWKLRVGSQHTTF